ncbi:hypothetical protein AB0I53_11980 [Saccharopolyspora sp. NPDC050389]|uniref:hypothetical protein n=1 Tax=Saccharopolyspora sp. NPDC050389 TaxID=3155516 RepID=UPI00340CF4E5
MAPEKMLVRYADVLCDVCTFQILNDGWGRRFDDLKRGDFRRCGACSYRARTIVEKHGSAGLVVEQPLKWLSEEDQREYAAVHEAAHAIVGTDAGFLLRDLAVGTQESTAGGISLTAGGLTRWEMKGVTVNTADYATYLVAGMRANLRWLADRGWDTHANRMDVAYGGFGDVVNLEDAVDGRLDMRAVMRDANRTVDARIEKRWPHITAVAQRLITHGRVDADEFRSVVDAVDRRTVPDPRPAQGPSKPSNPSSIAPISGGTAMSTLAEQARTALSLANEKATYVQGALQQAGLDIDDIIAQLAQVTTDAETVQQASGIYQQAKADLEQLQSLINSAVDTTQQYAGVL